ncbi:Protein argonaute [Elasticomyces elasticus]|uniref:Protein argonaute n=1 Tax=Elasticomyces elasticus TaxID=574655 RepID=A0AAN7VW35_9PEZI|nr:Protein argonaute [Elasticomyces elasticus]
MQYQQQMRPPHGQHMPPPPQHSRSAVPMQIAMPSTFRPNTSMPAPISLLNKHSEADTTEHDIAHSLSRSAVSMQGAMHAMTLVPASPALAFCRFNAERGAPQAAHCLSLPAGRLAGYGSPIDERRSFDSRKNQLSETASSRFLPFLGPHIGDLDPAEEGGKPKKSGKENKHRIVAKQTSTVGFQVLAFYLKGMCYFDNTMLESINFFDHCGLVADPGCGQQPEQQQQEQPVMAAVPILHCLTSVLAFKNNGNDDPELASSAGSYNRAGVLVDPKNFDGVARWSPFAAPALRESCLLVHALSASPSRSASTPSVSRSSSTPFASRRCLPFLRSVSESSLPSKKRSFMTTVRESKAVQNELGKGWIYDDNKLAWSITGRFAVEDNMSGNLGLEEVGGAKMCEPVEDALHLEQVVAGHACFPMITYCCLWQGRPVWRLLGRVVMLFAHTMLINGAVRSMAE